MIHVFVYFIPGAAGNFFTRCLNLVDSAICWSTPDSVPVNIEDKFQMLTYAPVMNSTYNNRNWVDDWEKKVIRVGGYQRIPENTKYFIHAAHPNSVMLNQPIKGRSDRDLTFYIDPTECFEWCVLNALYKNSHIVPEWLDLGEKMFKDPNIHKIKLKNIIDSQEGFLKEFQLVCGVMGHQLTQIEISLASVLYTQWKTTTLDYNKFNEFKQAIGFHM